MPTYSRRHFLQDDLLLTSLGMLAGCGVLSPPASRPGRLPRLGILGGGTPGVKLPGRVALEEGLREVGLIEGETVIFESRGTAGTQAERRPWLRSWWRSRSTPSSPQELPR